MICLYSYCMFLNLDYCQELLYGDSHFFIRSGTSVYPWWLLVLKGFVAHFYFRDSRFFFRALNICGELFRCDCWRVYPVGVEHFFKLIHPSNFNIVNFLLRLCIRLQFSKFYSLQLFDDDDKKVLTPELGLLYFQVPWLQKIKNVFDAHCIYNCTAWRTQLRRKSFFF